MTERKLPGAVALFACLSCTPCPTGVVIITFEEQLDSPPSASCAIEPIQVRVERGRLRFDERSVYRRADGGTDCTYSQSGDFTQYDAGTRLVYVEGEIEWQNGPTEAIVHACDYSNAETACCGDFRVLIE